jgi:hypothetical protein
LHLFDNQLNCAVPDEPLGYGVMGILFPIFLLGAK